jgi:formyltetrahydrofolate-dependent phosphoribosylglycinamide formyltransferase
MRIVVLISGNGSNLQALIDACASGRIAGEIVQVISNRKAAFGLTRAAEAGIETAYFRFQRQHDDRGVYDRQLADHIGNLRPDLIVLAGWMHILGPVFLDRFPRRVINLHPALPGEFPGKQAVVDAWLAFEAGRITRTGIMVHEVVPEIDAGPVLATAEVPILATDSIDDLYQRIHATEHRVLVDAVACWAPPEGTS